MADKIKTSNIFLRELIIYLLISNIIVWSFSIYYINQQRSERYNRALISANNLSVVFEHDIESVIKKIGISVLSIADLFKVIDINDVQYKEYIMYSIIQQKERVNEIQNILIANKEGQSIYDTNQQNGINVKERDFFQYFVNNDSNTLYISRPFIGRLSNKWLVVIAHRITDQSGQFKGVVWASIPLEYFSKIFSSVKIGKSGGISLRDAEMGIIARHPAPKDLGSIIGNKVLSPELKSLFDAGKTEGIFFTPTSWDNTAKVVAYKKIGEYPLYINVGVATDDYMEGWQQDTAIIAAIAICYTITTIILSKALHIRYKRESSANEDIELLNSELENKIKELKQLNTSLEQEVEKRTEKLKESEFLFKESQSAANIGSFQWNFAHNSWVASEVLDQVLGIDPQYPRTMRGWIKIIHPDSRSLVIGYLRELIEEKRNFLKEFRIVRKNDSRIRWVSVQGAPHLNNHGVIVTVIGTVQDITDRKMLESEREEMEHRLQQSQKMEAIGTLAGGIAHDFNNILGAVLGYAEMAKEDCEPGSKTEKEVDRVLEAGHRAVGLVKQILAFSRQTISAPVVLNPIAIAKETIKLLRPSLPSTITIQQQFDDSCHSVLADPTQIHQILMNLCTNSYHAMEHTGGILTIRLTNKEISAQNLLQYPSIKPGHFLVLTVKDTGHGVPMAIRDRIFEPYFSTKEVGRGTGMGLAIVHGIVTSLGGFVTCGDMSEQGAEFNVFLPAIVSENTPSMILKDIPSFLPKGQGHVLFVDDEEILADLGKSILERLGYNVTLCTDSRSALNLFQKHPDEFSILITDQTMPGMTGFDLARNILSIRPNLPIILCTGYSNLVDEKSAKQFGIKAFLMKPYTKKVLAESLELIKSQSL